MAKAKKSKDVAYIKNAGIRAGRTFVQAFVVDMGIKKLLSYYSHTSCCNFDLPPPKSYSQQLALFQVFRI